MTVAVHNDKTYKLIGIIKEKGFNRYILTRTDVLAVVKGCKIVSKIDDSVRVYDYRYDEGCQSRARRYKYMGQVKV